MRPTTNQKLKKGFTVLELLIVITVIGVLAGLVMVRMSKATEQANIAKFQVFSNSIRNSLMASRISEWKLNETGGIAAADIVGSKNGTLYNGPIWKPVSNCVSEGCLQFDGTNDYMSVPDLSTSFSQNIGTIEFWVKHLSNQTGGRGLVFSSGSRPLIYLSSNRLQVSWAGATGFPIGGGSYTNSYDVIGTNIFHHVVFSWDGPARKYKLYCDGVVLESRSSVTFPALNNAAEEIGRYSGGNYLNGIIDEVRAYKAALTVLNVKENYLAGLNQLLAKGGITEEEYQGRLAELDKDQDYAVNE